MRLVGGSWWITAPLLRVGSVDLLNRQAIIFRQFLIGIIAVVPRKHDRVLDRRMAQAQRVAKLMDRDTHKVCAPVTVLVPNQPGLFLVKVCVTAAVFARIECVRQHASGPLKVITVTMGAPLERGVGREYVN